MADVPGFGCCELGLSAAEETRAARLHRESIIVDLMFQGPCGYRSLGGDLLAAERRRWEESGSGDVFVASIQRIVALAAEGRLPDYERIWRESGLTATNLQIIMDHRAGDHLARLSELRNNGAWYGQALRPGELTEAKRAGRSVSFLNYQFIPPTVHDLAWFDEAAAIGVRMAGLTYNHANQFGAGCTAVDAGLTPFGREAVRRMNAVGMTVDVAHAGNQTTLDACRWSVAPVIASHAGATAVFRHDRNKSDEALRALASCGGVIGVPTVPMFMTSDLPGRIDLMFDHIDYIANLVGIDAVAVGTDWPMQLPLWVSQQGGPFEQWSTDMGFDPKSLERLDLNLVGFDDYRDMPNITRGLVKRGYTDEEIAKILGGNALRVIEATWPRQ
jgi:membrane dipeptidase